MSNSEYPTITVEQALSMHSWKVEVRLGDGSKDGKFIWTGTLGEFLEKEIISKEEMSDLWSDSFIYFNSYLFNENEYLQNDLELWVRDRVIELPIASEEPNTNA